MNKKLKLFFFFLAVLILPVMCQASVTILSNASPNHTVISGGDEQIYGTSASNQITLESGAKAELINFPGQNVIRILSDSDGFTVYRSGTIVTFQDGSGSLLKIPATTDPQTIEFSDKGPLTLSIHNGQGMLDDQVITSIPAPIESGQDEQTTCGAFVSPGVWKEFDCYNLAAIGKTTNDDPFTPSWRLIGGYWQWGRKGPDPIQWYDTNTEHFAHGPTGPDSSEANYGPISNWGDDYAHDGAWSDSKKTANDPCPEGFRVPTKSQWEGALDNNTLSTAGIWSNNKHDATNYSSALFFGSDLMLPAAGERNTTSGQLSYRGYDGNYWSSSTDSDNYLSWHLFFTSSTDTISYYFRRNGFSVRCVAYESTPCTFSISPNSSGFTSNSQSATVSVTTSDLNCAWTASENLSWVSLSPTNGTGSGNVIITVDANTGAARSGRVIIADQTYTISQAAAPSPDECGAYIAPDVWKEFDCYNLAAIGKTTNDDPFSPSWRLIGGYWMWGRKGPHPSQWHTTNTEHFAHGPTGLGTSEANEGSISGWDQTDAPNDFWSNEYKTANDPCPIGFRVPTKDQWQGVIDNNTQSTAGAWSISATNYSSALFFGSDLMLPATGSRSGFSGQLSHRGYDGNYWSSSEILFTPSAWLLYFYSGYVVTDSGNYPSDGRSVRCIAE
jgi:uncharacterized protein (TIGR02145 family)